MRILICDDHPVFREGLRDALRDLDATFLEAADADAALAQVAGAPDVDLVLLDLAMPGDGWAAFRALRSRHPSVPVVIVSSSEDPGDVRHALEAGAAGFVPKSSSLDVLRAALRLVFSGGVYVPPAALGVGGGEVPSGSARQRERAAQLTPRQLEVLVLLSRGLTNREIAGVLGIAEGTVKTHVRALFEILDVSNRTEATLVMQELGLEDCGRR